LVFAGDGRTWRLEVDQHLFHPGESRPSATVERCGNAVNWTPGIVNNLPQDDADAMVDIYCAVVRGSYDPNDKTGYPTGIGASHFIAPNGKLDYVIRFQNTGTDTAFTVVIKDTLDRDLDIFSVREGVASHNYSFRMYGPRVLEWTFHNILLPDSFTNEVRSHGFVTFTVLQNKDLPDGTAIANSAGIYFDFNEPIITNTASHIVNRNILQSPWTESISLSGNGCETYSFNDFTYTKPGMYWQIQNDTLVNLNVRLYGLEDLDLSVTQVGASLTVNTTGAIYQWLECDNDYSPISGERNQTFTPVVSGSYSVLIGPEGCMDTSGCYNFIMASVQDVFANDFNLSPNPTTGAVAIDLRITLPQTEVSIVDILGREVQRHQYNNTSRLNLKVEGEPGVYLLRISSGDFNATRKLLLVR